jgi:hypothetical protein
MGQRVGITITHSLKKAQKQKRAKQHKKRDAFKSGLSSV